MELTLKIKETFQGYELDKPKPIGTGGFANIYKVRDKKGEPYALKIFHSPKIFEKEEEQREREHVLSKIYDSIVANKNLINSDQSLVSIHTIKPQTNEFSQLSYLMDYIEADSLAHLFTNYRNFSRKAETISRVIEEYSSMLARLHDKEKVFVDNNLGAILVGDKSIRICDPDCIRSPNESWFTDMPFSREFASQEQILGHEPSKIGDLEALALITHTLFTGELFIKGDTCSQLKNEQAASNNHRKYPDEFKHFLTPKLRKIVPELIEYPRNEEITAYDFIEATKHDFNSLN